jgi:hypothetical protein
VPTVIVAVSREPEVETTVESHPSKNEGWGKAAEVRISLYCTVSVKLPTEPEIDPAVAFTLTV